MVIIVTMCKNLECYLLLRILEFIEVNPQFEGLIEI